MRGWEDSPVSSLLSKCCSSNLKLVKLQVYKFVSKAEEQKMHCLKKKNVSLDKGESCDQDTVKEGEDLYSLAGVLP